MTVRTAADLFLDNPNTVRICGIAVGKTAERLGEDRTLAYVEDAEIGEALELLWGRSAVNTWNARRGVVLSWTGWCSERGYEGQTVPAWAKRLAVDYVLETVYWDSRRRPAPATAVARPHPRAGLRHPPPPGAGQGRQPT